MGAGVRSVCVGCVCVCVWWGLWWRSPARSVVGVVGGGGQRGAACPAGCSGSWPVDEESFKKWKNKIEVGFF